MASLDQPALLMLPENSLWSKGCAPYPPIYGQIENIDAEGSGCTADEDTDALFLNALDHVGHHVGNGAGIKYAVSWYSHKPADKPPGHTWPLAHGVLLSSAEKWCSTAMKQTGLRHQNQERKYKDKWHNLWQPWRQCQIPGRSQWLYDRTQ